MSATGRHSASVGGELFLTDVKIGIVAEMCHNSYENKRHNYSPQLRRTTKQLHRSARVLRNCRGKSIGQCRRPLPLPHHRPQRDRGGRPAVERPLQRDVHVRPALVVSVAGRRRLALRASAAHAAAVSAEASARDRPSPPAVSAPVAVSRCRAHCATDAASRAARSVGAGAWLALAAVAARATESDMERNRCVSRSASFRLMDGPAKTSRRSGGVSCRATEVCWAISLPSLASAVISSALASTSVKSAMRSLNAFAALCVFMAFWCSRKNLLLPRVLSERRTLVSPRVASASIGSAGYRR